MTGNSILEVGTTGAALGAATVADSDSRSVAAAERCTDSRPTVSATTCLHWYGG